MENLVLKPIAKMLLADIKNGNDDNSYVLEVPKKTIEKFGVNEVAEATIGYIGSCICEMDTEKKYSNRPLTMHRNEDNSLTVQWYNKKRDKERCTKKNTVEWCNSCEAFKPFPDFKKCGQCQCKRYCSRECQKADWKKHKQVCVKKE